MKKEIDDQMLGNALCSSIKAHQHDILASFKKKSASGLINKVSDDRLAEIFDDFTNNMFLWDGLAWLETFSDKFRKIFKKNTSILEMYMLFTNSLFSSLVKIAQKQPSKIDKYELDELFNRINSVNGWFLECDNAQLPMTVKERDHVDPLDIQRSHRELQQVFDSITDPLFVVDSDLRLIRMNRFLRDKLMIKDYRDILGKKAGSIRFEGAALCKKSDLQDVFSKGKVKVSHVQLDAGRKYYVQYIYPIKDGSGADGAISSAFVYRKDLSAHKSMEDELQHMDRLATLGRLSTIIAHEIRNPLSGIGLSASLLRKKLSNDWQYLDSLENILQGIDRIESIINRLLDFSKPKKTEKKRVNVIDIIKDALFFVHSRANKGSVQIVEEYALDIPLVFVDPDQMTQVFINLFLNAIQSIKETGRITINVSMQKKNTIVIKIADSGAGIKQDDLLRIFEPFFTTKNDGTGLGLTISKNILMQNDIDISVKSKLSKGTTFVLKVDADYEV